MEIMMFIIFIITNLIIILCMQFAYTHAYKYENGMYLNVHIPSSHKEDAEVTEIVTTGKRKMKHFQIANVIISIAICFIVFINIAVFVLVYIIWMFAYIFGIIHIPNSSHRKENVLKCSQFPSCVDFTGFNCIQNCVYCYYLSFFSKIALKHRPHYFHI